MSSHARRFDLDPRTVLAGFAVAVAALGVLAVAVGPRRIGAAVAVIESPALAAVVATAFLWLGVWGLSLYTMLRTLAVEITVPEAMLAFASATFLNGLTPFAQVGGEALSAAVISRATSARYETCLAGVAAVDLINLVPSVLFAVVGAVSIVVTGGPTAEFRLAAGAMATVVAVAAAVGGLVWRFRDGVGAGAVDAAVRLIAAANRFTARVTPIDPAAVGRRIETLFDGFERLLADRRRLAVCLTLSALGWLCLAATLWLSLDAVGHAVPAGGVCFVLPVAMLAVAVPLPGGVGGVEAALIGLTVGVLGVPLVEATAAVALYRGATYWLPLAVGGAATAVLGLRRPVERPE